MHNPIQTLSLLYFSAFESLGSARGWRPLAAFWLLQVLLLLWLSRFPELPGGAFLGALFASWFDPEIAEYPRLYLWLPDIHSRIYLPLAATLGIIFQSVCTVRLAERYGRGRLTLPNAWKRALKRWPGLFLLNAIGLALVLLPLFASQRWLAPLLPEGMAQSALRAGSLAFGLALDAFLVYAAYMYLVYRNGIRSVIASSFHFARQRYAVSFGLVMIPYLLALPLRAVIGMPRGVMETFRPELILYLLLISSLFTMLLLFLQLATIVRYHIAEVSRGGYTDF